MVQWRRMHTALEEAQVWFCWLPTVYSSSSRESDTLCWLLQAPTPTYTNPTLFYIMMLTDGGANWGSEDGEGPVRLWS